VETELHYYQCLRDSIGSSYLIILLHLKPNNVMYTEHNGVITPSEWLTNPNA